MKELKNGAVLNDDGTVTNGEIIKNTSDFTPFNYNVVDEDGNVIQVVQIGKPKITMHSIEGVK